MRRGMLLIIALFAMGCFFGPLLDVADACPMCKIANETDDRLPRAYMYSILFMLAVPGSIFTGFGIGLYRLSKRENADLESTECFQNDRRA